MRNLNPVAVMEMGGQAKSWAAYSRRRAAAIGLHRGGEKS
jgi:hypothetical protein